MDNTSFIDALSRDIRYTLRTIRHQPGFAFMAILTVAIGIGANTAIFSVVNGVLIKPLPYPNPDAVVGVWHRAPGLGTAGDVNCSPTMFFTYRDENRTLESVGLWTTGSTSVTGGAAEPEQVRTLWVTYGTLQALGVQPTLGRWFTSLDDTPGTAENPVILTYGYWQRHFGGDRSVIGRDVTIDSRLRQIIGVMPREFRFLNADPELILTLRFDRNRVFLGNFSYQGIARLKPGVTIADANKDIERILPIWLQAWPPAPGADRQGFVNWSVQPALRPLKQDVVGNAGNTLWVLMATVGLVLLIACANVANLLFVRTEGRQQELMIRTALGASRRRIASVLLLESLMIGLAGGVLGVALAYAGLRLLVSIGPANLPRLGEITMDAQVLAFAFVVSLLSSLLFGFMPVLKYTGSVIGVGLRGGSRTSSPSRERRRTRDVLVITQVALALVLLVSAGLMIRTFQALRAVRPGFVQADQIQTMRITIPTLQVQEPERVTRTQQAIADRIAAIPGISSVAFANGVPMEGVMNTDPIFVEDKTYTPGQTPPMRRFKYVSPGFFQTIGTRLVAGRDITWTDIYDHHAVALLSENLARELWGNPSAAIGKRLRGPGLPVVWREVIGVTEDVRENGVQEAAPRIVFWPVLMENFYGNPINVTRSIVFVMHSGRAGSESFLNEVRSAVWSVNRNLPLASVRTLDDIYRRSMASTSFTLVMLAIAGTMALLLGIVGIYGVISYTVSQRTREIGIRIALGAEQRAVQRMFVLHGLALAAIGAAIGLGAAAASTRFMRSLLFGISPLDPWTYVAVPFILIAAAVLAAYLPARRASSVDPMEALRAE